MSSTDDAIGILNLRAHKESRLSSQNQVKPPLQFGTQVKKCLQFE